MLYSNLNNPDNPDNPPYTDSHNTHNNPHNNSIMIIVMINPTSLVDSGLIISAVKATAPTLRSSWKLLSTTLIS